MKGYKYATEQEAIDARSQAAAHAGFPNSGGDTLYWANYAYSNSDNFYYIAYVDGLENALGEPIEFEITISK